MIVLFFFFYLLVNSILRIRAKETLLSNLLKNERFLWLIIYLSLFISIFIAALFIQERDWFGSFYNVFLRMQPTLIWLLLIFVQTFLFSFFWYCINFTGNFTDRNNQNPSKDVTILLGILIFFLLVKIVLIIPYGYGMIKDVGESKYLYMIEYLFEGIFLHSANPFTTHYPFLYPVTLLFTLFIKDYSFEAIKIINSFYATSIIFPIFLISRQLVDRKTGYALVLISSFIPFQFLLPTRLLSENLYFPLFLWVIYLIYVSPGNQKYRLLWDGLTGIGIGILYLTRYITLALIPFLLFLWWTKPFKRVENLFQLDKHKTFHFILLLLLIVVTFSPWIFIGLKNGLHIRETLGFGIAEETNPQQLTTGNFLKWILFYLGYFILIASPTLNLLFILARQKIKNEDSRRWLYIVFTLFLAFLIAVVRHSWRADYNSEIPIRIMGRYIIYFVPLFLITSFLAIKLFDKERYKSIWQFLLLNLIFPVGLIILSYLLVIKGTFFSIEKDFVNPLISIDGYYIKILGLGYFLIIFALFAVTNFSLWTRNPKILELSALMLILFFIIGEPKYLQYHKEIQYYQEIGTRISNLMISCNQNSKNTNSYKIYLPNNISKDDKQDIEWSLYIRNLNSDYSISSYSANNMNNVIEREEGIIVYPIINYLGKIPDTGIFKVKEGDYMIEILNAESYCRR